MYALDGAASFDLPEDLPDMNSIQLIWAKKNETQCVCPPVQEILSQCACNKIGSKNLVTISDGRLEISNFVEELDNVLFYFANSSSSGCQNGCNVRSIAQTYKIVIRGKLI